LGLVIMDGQRIEMSTASTVDVPSVLEGYGKSQRSNPAILAPGRSSLTFAALYVQQQYVRRALEEWGVGRGDIIAVLLPKGPELAVAIAVLPVSATVMPMDPNLSADDYERLFRRSGAKALVVPHGLQHFACVAAERTNLFKIELVLDPDAPAGAFKLTASGTSHNCGNTRSIGSNIAYILSTSGTSAERKLIPYSHENMVAYARAMTNWFEYRPSDLSIHLMPMHFAHGVKSALMVPLLSGTSIVCPPDYNDMVYSCLFDSSEYSASCR
jgi:acyl-coenzyme A synthetase/AMP-(fatty) acid ligase